MSTQFIQEVLRLTNQFRAANNLAPLTLNSELSTAAHNHSKDLAAHDIGGHTGSNGSDVLKRVTDAGYQPRSTWAENVARGQTTPQQVVDGWVNSPGHRANLLNPNFTEIGIGYVNSRNANDRDGFADYWTQVFSNGDTNPGGPSQPGSTPKPGAVPNAIIGTDAADTLTGTDKNDFIIGLGGGDKLTGGAGADLFIFTKSNQGRDTITDFNANQGDKIVFVGQEFFDGSLGATNSSFDWATRTVSYGNRQMAHLEGTNTFSSSTGTSFASLGLPDFAV